VGVAFVTLMERRILGLVQLRKGPLKVGYLGLFQPFSDAIRLFFKERSFLLFFNVFLYYFFSLFSLVLILIYWFVYFWGFEGGMCYDILFVVCVSRLGVYRVLLSG